MAKGKIVVKIEGLDSLREMVERLEALIERIDQPQCCQVVNVSGDFVSRDEVMSALEKARRRMSIRGTA